MKPRIFSLVFLLFFALLPLKSAVSDSLVVSLLTCSAGEVSYEVFGHTALRVNGPDGDLTYNFGVFDFEAPCFVWRFVLGKTDYMLRAMPTKYFLWSYTEQGRSVVEQQLALTFSEAVRVAERLANLAADSGWTYRYNFLRDNCTTRALDVVEECIGGYIVWPDSIVSRPSTLREVIDSCSACAPWTAFGQDLMLGSEIDRPASREALMFSPLLACSFVQDAFIVDRDGNERRLVGKVNLFEAQTEPAVAPCPFTPMVAMSVLLVQGLFLTILEIRRKKKTVAGCVLDAVLLLVQGLAGCVIFVLRFFSEHPAVDSNRLVMLLNPLPLIVLLIAAFACLRRREFPAMALVAWQAVWLLLDDWFVGVQFYPLAIILFAWLLLLRGGLSVYLYKFRSK